ncbi:MAG: S9 family peptidase [Gemmatimonadaceae bacterium]|nr:S9 family peptidase [Gemmatimonadaceae bacterium]
MTAQIRRRATHWLALALPLLLAPALDAQARRPLRADDMYRLRDVGDPRVSPDGGWIAYTLSTIDSLKDTRDTDVWMVNWAGTRHIQLTRSAEDETDPRWSPDNRFLSFLAGRDSAPASQVWLLDRTGGEPQQLTDFRGGVSEQAWSPDGTRLAVLVHDPSPDTRPDSVREKQPRPIVIDRYAFKRDRDGYLDRRRDHVWIVDVATRAVTQVTSGDFDDAGIRWSPDGSRLAFTSNREEPDPDRSNNTDIFVVEARAGAVPRRLTTWPGPDSGPEWSPDGTSIAYLQGSEPRFYAYDQPKIAVVPSAGGTPRFLATALDRDVAELTWTRDGRALRVLVSDDRAGHLATIRLADGAVVRETSGRRVTTSYDVSRDGRIVVRMGTAVAGAELHELTGSTFRALTHVNDSVFASLQLGATEDISFRNPDGLTVGALLIKPPDFVPGRRYPLVLRIHGGPSGQDEHLFDTGAWMPTFERQLFAAQGYLVLAVNYRGSSGRGEAWHRAIYADWGNKELQDLSAGVDHLIATGLADPARLGIGGWSYGGILTDYMIARTTRFRAATSGAGSALQSSMYGADQYVMQYERELGQPWKSKPLWDKVSAAFWNAGRITTPTLFLGGASDFNVPILGGEQMFQALRSNGVPTQLVIYPDEYHEISRPSFVRDRLERFTGWYAKYLAAPTP